DVEFMDLLESDDEAIAALVEARLGLKSSILQSRIERFLSISRRGLLPVPLLYAGATPTRRWSGTDQINLQNLPRSKKGSPSPLRQAICAPPGYKLVAADLSQIELRANCWQSGQNDVLELLRTGGDTYADMATAVFGYPVHKDTHPNERFVGKTAVLGCGYQCGAAKFQHML
ncbi:DNA polymerase, partial [Klebsiella pneumoniae]|nr:DNA polymerase [Klebsiella pneumoniae]